MKIRSPLVRAIGAVVDLGLDGVGSLATSVGASSCAGASWVPTFSPSWPTHPTTSLHLTVAPSPCTMSRTTPEAGDSTSLVNFSELISNKG